MQWKRTRPAPAPLPERIEIRDDYITISLSDVRDDPAIEAGNTWQFFTLSIGEFSPFSLNDTRKTWPYEAIEMAEKAIAEFKAKLLDELEKSITL